MNITKELLSFATPSQAQAIEAYIKHGTYGKTAKSLGVSRQSLTRMLQRVLKKAGEQGFIPNEGAMVIPLGHHARASTIHVKDGEVQQYWSKSVATKYDLTEALKGVAEELCEKLPKAKKVAKTSRKFIDESLTAYIIGDAHIGLYAQAYETGLDNHDVKIGCDDLDNAVSYLVDSSAPTEIGVVVNVGDFFHINDKAFTTPASKNTLDADGRFSHIVRKGAGLLRRTVQKLLKKHAEVWVINARGNHDEDLSIPFNMIIEAHFENDPRVTVWDNAQRLLHFTYGKNLVVIHHGDKMKRTKLYEAATRNLSAQWGEAVKRYSWNGHIHHKQVEEIGGMRFETFNSLVAPDQYHAEAGYGSERSMTSITLHKEFGEVGRNICDLALARSYS